MNELVRQQYDSLYANTDLTFGDGKPLKLLKELNHHVSSGAVLDVGGGDGRNALALAKMGYEVTVIDLSEIGLAKLQKLATKEGLVIRTVCGDIMSAKIDESYDVIIMSFVLHHIDADEARKIISKLQNHTKPHGVHLIATFSNAGGLYERAKKSDRFYPSAKEMENLYKNWETLLLQSKSVATLAKDKSGKPYQNQTLFYLGKKLD